jgi:hypothetical protein
MRRSELEPVTASHLFAQARQILVQEQQFTPENAADYLYELAQARKLFLADAAAQIVAGRKSVPSSRPWFTGARSWRETPGGHEGVPSYGALPDEPLGGEADRVGGGTAVYPPYGVHSDL